MTFQLLRYVGLSNLRDRPVVSVLTVLGVASGISLYVAIQVLNRAALDYFNESVSVLSGKAALVVHGGANGFAEETLDRAAAVPGVAAAVPLVETIARHGSDVLHILGVDLLQEGAAHSYASRTAPRFDGRPDDPLDFIADPTSLILSETFAKARGIAIGDKVTVDGPRGSVELTVKRLLSPPGLASAYGGLVGLMDIDAARIQFERRGRLDRVDIVAGEGIDPAALADRLRRALGPGLEIERPENQAREKERVIRSFQVMMRFLSLSGLVIGIFLVANSMSVLVAERRKQIGVLRAVGATRGGIAGLFVAEAGLLGLIGSILGAFLGLTLARWMDRQVLTAMSPLEAIRFVELPFQGSDRAIAVGLGFLGACMGAALPSYRASLVSPVEAMRGREAVAEAPVRSGRDRLWVLGLGLIGLAAAISGHYRNVNEAGLVFGIQAVAILGVALLAPRAVLWALRRLSGRLRGVGMLAQANLVSQPRRLGLNVMSLSVGLVLVVVIAGSASSLKGTLLEWYSRRALPDFTVTRDGKAASAESPSFDERLVQGAERLPGVASVRGVRLTRVPFRRSTPILKALDDVPEELRAGSSPSVLASPLFLERYGHAVGDRIELPTVRGPVAVRIAGTVEDYASLQGVLWIARPAYLEWFRDPLVSEIDVRTGSGADATAVRSALESLLAQRGLVAVSNTELKAESSRRIEDSFRYTDAIEAIALLIALLGLLNTTFVGVIERRRELGILRAVGMTSRQLTRMLVVETALQSILAAVIAVILGLGFGAFWIQNNLAAVLGWPVTFHFPVKGVLETLALAAGIGILAGWLPSKTRARANPVDALAYE